jgi:hypothetical protein
VESLGSVVAGFRIQILDYLIESLPIRRNWPIYRGNIVSTWKLVCSVVEECRVLCMGILFSGGRGYMLGVSVFVSHFDHLVQLEMSTEALI